MFNPETDYVFILGDSRTGTTSLHLFFKELGVPAKHYFIEEAEIKGSVFDDYEYNLNKTLEYIRNSEFRCFSDYPVRPFYKELYSKYPNAIFILSKRVSDESWKQSMLRFFEKSHNMNIETVEKLFKHYKRINNDIYSFFSENSDARFLEIEIDDKGSSEKLSRFIGLDTVKQLEIKNKSK